MIDIDAAVDAMDETGVKEALKRILHAHMTPAFGALSKRETELMMFGEMTRLGVVPADASLYDLVTGLRITRSKASQLVFDREVRRGATAAELDVLTIEAVASARFVKDGDFLLVEEENPLVHAHLRERLKRLRHLSDTSFNAAIVKMTIAAAQALLTDLIPDERREEVRRALVEAGAPDRTMGHVMGAALKKLGGKATGAAGDAAIDSLKEYLKPLMMGAPGVIASQWTTIFA